MNSIILAMLLSMPLRSMECVIPYSSNITNAWTVGTTITQTSLAILQFFLGFASVLTDGYFFYFWSSPEVHTLQERLEELRKEHKKLKDQENLLIETIWQELYPYIENNQLKADKEIIDVLLNLSKKFRQMAEELR
jgi:hypothetical protein